MTLILGGTQHNDYQHNDSQHNNALQTCSMSICWLSRFTYYCAERRYAERRYAECHYTERHYADRRYAKCRYFECRGADQSYPNAQIVKNAFLMFKKITVQNGVRFFLQLAVSPNAILSKYTSKFCKKVRAMFVERQVSFSALFTVLVGWHISAVSLPPGACVIKILR